MVEPPRRTTRRLSIEVPTDLAEKLVCAAELAHQTLDQLVVNVLTYEITRWDAAFGPPAPPADSDGARDTNPTDRASS